MFLDACVIVSILTDEESRADYEAAMQTAPNLSTSILAAWEAIIILSRPDHLNCRFGQAEAVVIEWLEARDVRLREPAVPKRVLSLAVKAAETQGVGTRALSTLDCFHYAYAKALRMPLLTLDAALRKSDVETLP